MQASRDFKSVGRLFQYLEQVGPGILRDDLVVVIGAGPGKHELEEMNDVALTPWAAASGARLTLTFMGESPQTGLELSGILTINAKNDVGFAEVRFTGLHINVNNLFDKRKCGMYVEGVDCVKLDNCYVFGNTGPTRMTRPGILPP